MNLLPFQGEALFFPGFFTPEESEDFLRQLQQEVGWKHEKIRLFGRDVLQPRLTAWYGDAGKAYSYSGITMQPGAWTPALLEIKQRVEATAQVTFNSALLNLYRNGKDSVGWHRDNEKELGKNPVIGSVSFGATRQFQLRNHKEKTRIIRVELSSGSFLLMRGETQHFWEHRIPKTTRTTGPRINITFRVIR